MTARYPGVPRGLALVALGSIVLIGGPDAVEAQGRWFAGHAQITTSGTEHGGLGHSLSLEMGVLGPLRVAASRVEYQGIRECQVTDIYSECGTRPVMWNVEGRLALELPEAGMTPFLGVGMGLYRRTWYALGDGSTVRYLENPKRRNHPSISLSAGFDIRAMEPLAIRLMILHQEVFNSDLEGRYDGRVSPTALSVGLGLASW